MNTLDVQPMTARRLIRLAVVRVLQQKLDAGFNIFSPGAWPTPQEKLPAVLVRTPREDKQSKGRNVPQFDSTITIEVMGQLEADTPDAAQDAIDALAYQVEQAIFEGYWLGRVVQQFTSVSTETEINTEGKKPLGGFKMSISCETYEAYDPFEVIPDATTWPLDEPGTGNLQGINLHADTAQPFDALGTYPPGVFPDAVAAAPRTAGPDGRDEGLLQIDLPQA